MRKYALAAIAAMCLLLVGLSASAQDRQSAAPQGTAYTTPDPAAFVTRVFVTRGQETTGQVNGSSVHLNSDETLSVVWMSSALKCDGSSPAEAGKFSAPSGAALTCATETQGVMSGITAVTARVPAPLSSGSYSFNVEGCASCARDIMVTTNDPFLTTTTGYDRDQVDAKLSEVGNSDNCCDLAGGYIMMPDTSDSTATMGHGFNLLFQARPHKWFGLGLQYSYLVSNVWLNPLLRDPFTDDDQPEHLHQIHGRAVLSAPVIEGDHDWLRLEIGALIGGSIWHYETLQYKQYLGTGQLEASNNETIGTFDLGATGGVNFYPHENVLLQLGIDAVTNVNGINRMRSNTTAAEREEPESGDGHDLRLGMRFNLGVAF